MKKEELSPAELQQRTSFVERVTQAGWDVGGWEDLFAAGVSLTPEAQAEYQNRDFNLRLAYCVAGGYVRLECDEIKGDEQLMFRFYPRGDLNTVLKTVISEQDSLSPENYPAFVKKMIPLCNPALFEGPDRELVQLS